MPTPSVAGQTTFHRFLKRHQGLTRRPQQPPDTSRASPMGTDLVTVTTPLMTVQIDKYGGDMVTLDLQKYAVTVDQPESPLRLLDNGMYRSYTAMSGLMGA